MFGHNPFAVPISSFQRPVPLVLVDPDDEPDYSVCFRSEWLPYILGSLEQLLLQTTWKTDDPDALALQQDRARLLLSLFMQGCPSMLCPCPRSEIVDGVPMYTMDGTHFYPYPGEMNDPAIGGYGHWPTGSVPDGENGRCLAATNIASIYKSSTQTFLNLLAIDAAIGDMVGAVTTAMGFIIEPVVILAWAVDFVAGMLDATFGALENAASDENVEIIKCAIDCNISFDGSISHAQFEAIADSVTTSPGGAIGLYMLSFLYGLGPVGLERMEKMGITDGTCDCGCDEWCYSFDFTDNDGGFSSISGANSPYGTYSAGVGWVGRNYGDCAVVPPGCEDDVRITRGLSASTTITKVVATIDTDRGSVPPDGGADFFVDGVYSGTQVSFSVGTDVEVVMESTLAGSSTFRFDIANLSGAISSLLLKRLTVYGAGTNPFGSDNC